MRVSCSSPDPKHNIPSLPSRTSHYRQTSHSMMTGTNSLYPYPTKSGIVSSFDTSSSTWGQAKSCRMRWESSGSRWDAGPRTAAGQLLLELGPARRLCCPLLLLLLLLQLILLLLLQRSQSSEPAVALPRGSKQQLDTVCKAKKSRSKKNSCPKKNSSKLIRPPVFSRPPKTAPCDMSA